MSDTVLLGFSKYFGVVRLFGLVILLLRQEVFFYSTFTENLIL